MEQSNFQVLLFYKYVAINDPELLRDEQRALCESLQLKGRIIVATEGINGTLEGTKANVEAYIHAMREIAYFNDIQFKISVGTGDVFPKLAIRVRPEIVTAGMPELNPIKITGKYISAEELHNWFTNKKEFYILDMRNDYEYNIGYFENFVPSGLKNFFYLSDMLPRIEHLKHKTIVTVCTGGVRCEKGSGYLLSNGFNDVYQLKDGIQTYMEKYPNEHFKGKLFVFDKRFTIGFNTDSPEHEIVGKCRLCGASVDTYLNCGYDICHELFVCCQECRDKETGLGFCNQVCKANYLEAQRVKSSATL